MSEMIKNAGDSNRITREYLDSLLIETRYMDATNPTTKFELYGKKFSSPIMTAALSHLDSFMFPGAAESLAWGAKDADALLWYGMAEEEEIDRLLATGVQMIEIIKPYAERDLIFEKIEQAEEKGVLAVGVDIDHPFAEDGTPDVIHDLPMKALTTRELANLCASTKLPFIVKGVLSQRDAERALYAGARGLVLSHHNNRIEYALPPISILPQVADMAGKIPVFVDGEIRTGMDAFKALALGAKGVCIGRPLMTAIKKDPENGVRDYLLKARDELAKAMAFTGCADLSQMDRSIIHRL